MEQLAAVQSLARAQALEHNKGIKNLRTLAAAQNDGTMQRHTQGSFEALNAHLLYTTYTVHIMTKASSQHHT